MADKLTPMLLDAIGRAARAPGGTPLHGTKAAPGLFATSALARQAARRACDEGLLHVVGADPGGRADRARVAATEKGLALLLEQTSPRQVLEDLVRAVEARQEQVAGLIAEAREARASLDAIKAVAGRALQRVADAPAAWTDDLLDHLARWHDAAPGDCPLPELYRRLHDPHSDLTIGRFHDGLRAMHDRERVYLHPWTGPLYALPEPAFALLVGHEVAYYASSRTRSQETGVRSQNGSADRRAPMTPDPAPA